MRVLILSQFYPPEHCAASNRTAAMAERVASDGHETVVVTGCPSFPSGTVEAAYRGRWRVTETIRGVRVIRVWTYASSAHRSCARLLNWLSVALGALVVVADPRRRFDVVIVSTPPITLALPAIVAKVVHRAMLVADIRDVFPEIAVSMGEWRSDGRIARVVGYVADFLYRAARLIVAVTESARTEIVRRGVPALKVVLAPNGFDAVVLGEPVYRPAGSEIVVAYVGNIGLAAGMDVVIDAAEQLAGDGRFTFLLIGDGADASRIRERVQRSGLEHVKMLGVIPRPQAMSTLREAHLCVVPLRANILDSLPTKLFDALSVGCPVVVSAEGEARRLVEESGCGAVVPPGDGAALAEAIRALADDEERRRTCARRGREYVREHYDRAKVMARLSAQLFTLQAEEQPSK